ncbi:hypothetical protein I7I53_11241 [Histoplasma capsulatum var. duboisii H88]|uniref:Uncharacterized protein n=1 Tax=Ajellomyces capsulatus (strain H88) TaxID=544711 RepID=A0A8A1L7X9_AJEC8|nr:hypothetical protein I7I53_11241 [Histoplasma capsulatum var. duboisii H88]
MFSFIIPLSELIETVYIYIRCNRALEELAYLSSLHPSSSPSSSSEENSPNLILFCRCVLISKPHINRPLNTFFLSFLSQPGFCLSKSKPNSPYLHVRA